MEIPKNVTHLLRRLTDRGHKAYAVGGCVRDTLLGRTPGDWDICTSAAPEETEGCFSDLRVIETGLKHGTVTVLLEGEPYEITTFRRDGDYTDHRRPEQVEFVEELREDLARRDFTINAMAAGANGVVIDLFDGRADLEKKLLRCVGDPDKRFREDALRILRGLRFASQLGFSIEARTAGAMERNKELLAYVSGERINTELTKLLMGDHAAQVLERYGTVLLPVLPEIGPAMGFLQQNPCHDRDVWLHTLRAIELSPAEPRVRWTLLLHDLGKPDTFTVDSKGIGHFHGHPQRSEELAEGILRRLRVDNGTREMVCELVRRHDEGAPVTRKVVRRWISRMGAERLRLLMQVKRADCLAHADTPRTRERYAATMEFTDLVEQVLREESCFQIKDLKIGGREVLACGAAPGPRVGKILEQLLGDVLEERCENDREKLLERTREILLTGERENHAD